MYVLTDVGEIICSIVLMIYLECHWNGGPSVEDTTLETKKSWGSEKGQGG